jgi:hypothetical protein
MRKIFRRSRDGAEAIISTLVDAVVARPTDHDTIAELVGTAELYVFDVMGLSAFPKLMFGTAGFTNGRNRRSA